MNRSTLLGAILFALIVSCNGYLAFKADKSIHQTQDTGARK